MNPEFDIVSYKKYNKDLQNKTDEELLLHFNEIGQYQIRIYSCRNDINKTTIRC